MGWGSRGEETFDCGVIALEKGLVAESAREGGFSYTSSYDTATISDRTEELPRNVDIPPRTTTFNSRMRMGGREKDEMTERKKSAPKVGRRPFPRLRAEEWSSPIARADE